MTLLIIAVFISLRFAFHFNLQNSGLPIENLSWSKSFRKVAIYRIDTIYYGFIGAYLAYYYKSIWLRFRAHSFVLGVILFLITHIYIYKNNLEPTLDSLFFNGYYLVIVFISILLLFPVFSTWKKGRFFTKIITKISIWSYAIYLINYSIVLLTIKELVVVSDLNTIQKIILLIAFWAITFLLSFLLYNLYEKPFTQLRDSKRIKNYFTSK